MSAYMIDRKHVRYLVNAAAAAHLAERTGAFRWYHGGKWIEMRQGQSEHMREVGQMLWDENSLSVAKLKGEA